jgi:hypothetical protein
MLTGKVYLGNLFHIKKDFCEAISIALLFPYHTANLLLLNSYTLLHVSKPNDHLSSFQPIL